MNNSGLLKCISIHRKRQDTEISTKMKDKRLRRAGQLYFAICDSCYWCATCFSVDDVEYSSASALLTLKCPLCNSFSVKVMLISNDDSCTIKRTLTRGWS